MLQLSGQLPHPLPPFLEQIVSDLRIERRSCLPLNLTRKLHCLFCFTVRAKGWLPILSFRSLGRASFTWLPAVCWTILFSRPGLFPLSHDWWCRNEAPLHFWNQFLFSLHNIYFRVLFFIPYASSGHSISVMLSFSLCLDYENTKHNLSNRTF